MRGAIGFCVGGRGQPLADQSERKLTNSEGLPNRPWFKHQLYAPGFYTG